MGSYVLGLDVIGQNQLGIVGGKGAHLGELSRIEGILVPTGFCVTTEAFQRIVTEAPSIDERLERLAHASLDDQESIGSLSAAVRRAIEGAVIPDDLATAITNAVAQFGEDAAYAVRSSATAEDRATASFAGQQDTYLNVVGSATILEHIRRCWASLFTERAVAYRQRHGIDHRLVQMAVVVQQMVVPHAAGVVFTADPVTANRKVVSVEATFGLGEPLVSGRVTPDVYQVREGEIVSKSVATKPFAAYASPAGGTEDVVIGSERQDQPALTDAQVLALAQLGRRIEAHFGCPQDIEWCLANQEFQFVQSRPITTLFPIPVTDDGANHVYVSVGHQQMMTDAMKPLGISLWLLTTRRPMFVAGGRLFVDVAQVLGSRTNRAAYLEALGRSDPLIGDALGAVIERGDFIPMLPDNGSAGPPPLGVAPPGGAPTPLDPDPTVVTELIEESQRSIAVLQNKIRSLAGSELLDFILADIGELQRLLFDPPSMTVIMAGMQATWWLNEHLEAWLGEKNAADALTQSVPHNVTSEMGLALLDVADVIRPYPAVVALLEHVVGDDQDGREVHDGDFLGRLAALEGGPEARDALLSFLDKYGMRCVGEIDITRPRWTERPATLVPLLLSNIQNFEPDAAERHFEHGREVAQRRAQEVLGRLAGLPDGEQKADETRRNIDRVRTFSGYRDRRYMARPGVG